MNRYKTFKAKTGYCTVDTEAEIKPNTNTFIEGLNGDWYYNSIYKSIARVGDITPYDFKVIACHPPLENVATYCELPKDDVERFTLNDMRRCWNYAADPFEEHTLEGGSLEMNFDQFIATLSKHPDWQFIVEETFLNNANTDELKRSEFVPKIINNVLFGKWIKPTPSTIG